MYSRNTLNTLIWNCLLLLLMIERCLGSLSIGNATVSIFAGTNPIEEFPYAEVNQHGDPEGWGDNVTIKVKLPGETQMHILSRPCAAKPGWQATAIATTVTVTSPEPENMQYIYKDEDENGRFMLDSIECNGSKNVQYLYDNTNEDLLVKEADMTHGSDPDLSLYYIEYEYDPQDSDHLVSFTLTDDSGQEPVTREYEIVYDEPSNPEIVIDVTNTAGGGGCCGGRPGSRFLYNSNGRIWKVLNGNDDVVYEHQYDTHGRLTHKYLGPVTDANHIQEVVYDDGQNIIDTRDYVDASNYRITRELRNRDAQTGLISSVERTRYQKLNDDPANPQEDCFTDTIVYDEFTGSILTKKKIIPPLGDPGGIRKVFMYEDKRGKLKEEWWYKSDDSHIVVNDYTYQYVYKNYPYQNEVMYVRPTFHTDIRGGLTAYVYSAGELPDTVDMPEVSEGIDVPYTHRGREYTYNDRAQVKRQMIVSCQNHPNCSGRILKARTDYEYDDFGNLKKRRDSKILSPELPEPPAENTEDTVYHYNGFNEKIKVEEPTGVVRGWTYYPTGKVKDELVYPDATDEVNAYSQVRYAYDPNGYVSTVERAVYPGLFAIDEPENWPDKVVTSYEYDLQGNRTAIIEDDEPGSLQLRTEYQYNNQSEVVKVTLPNGKWTETIRNGRGLVTETKVGYGEITAATTKFEYDENGNLDKQIAPDGVVTKYKYDDFDRVREITKGWVE